MRQIPWVSLVLFCLLHTSVTSNTEADTRSKVKEKEKTEVLKEFRSFADSMLPEQQASEYLVEATKVKDPQHPYALDISGPSAGTSHNKTEILDIVRKDTSSTEGNILARLSNETNIMQVNATSKFNGEPVAESVPSKAFEKANKSFLDQDQDDDGYNTDEVAPTVREKEKTNDIAEALATATDGAENNSLPLGDPFDDDSSASSAATGTAKKKSHKESKNTTIIAKPDENPDDEVDTYVEEKEEKPKQNGKSTAIKKKPEKARKGSENHVLKNHRNLLRPLKHQMGAGVATMKIRPKNPNTLKKPAPNNFKKPAPSALKKPAPSALKKPSPSAIKKPVPSALKKPAPSAFKKPAPSAFKKPAPSAFKKPAPSAFKKPLPSALKKPLPSAFRKPIPNAIKESLPNAFRKPISNPIRKPVANAIKKPVVNALRKPVANALKKPVANALKKPAGHRHIPAEGRSDALPPPPKEKSLKSTSINQSELTAIDMIQGGIPMDCNGLPCMSPPVPAPPQPPPFVEPPPEPACLIPGCPAACAPACTPACCKEEMMAPPPKSRAEDTSPPNVKVEETAPPPPKDAVPPKSNKIVWVERAHYEPGPNVPPPPLPAMVKEVVSCGLKCPSTCAPACKADCCHPPPAIPIVGCTKQCTPDFCVWGCPAHCCARYIRKSKVMAPQHVLLPGAKVVAPQHVLLTGAKVMAPQHVLLTGAKVMAPQHVLLPGAKLMTPQHVMLSRAKVMTPQHVMLSRVKSRGVSVNATSLFRPNV